MEELVNEVGKKVENKLKEKGVRVKLDVRSDITPGSKFYEWEMRGVPLRIEVGPRDIKERKVTFVRRDNFEKLSCEENELVEKTKSLLADIRENLRKRAWEWLNLHICKAKSLDEAKKLIDSGFGIVQVPWCGERECGLEIEREVNTRVLGVPSTKVKAAGACVVCGRKGEFLVRLARAY